MANLKAVLDSIDDLPEPIQELYSKKGDKYELTGIDGVKTSADVDRVQKLNNTLREENKTLKGNLAAFGDLNAEEVHAKLDKYDELEAAASGKLDEGKIEKMVETRVKSQLAPKDRDIKKLSDENALLRTENEQLKAGEKRRRIHDAVRAAAVEAKLLDTAVEDALFMAERVMDVAEDGAVVTKDNVGVTPLASAADWLQEIQPKRPHWWPPTQGGGGRGTGNGPGGYANNPWSAEHWNATEQGRIYREKGADAAKKMAESAGTTLGGPRPAKKAA